MKNKCYVISRDQASDELDIVECDCGDDAKVMVKLNRINYKDSVYLTLDDLKQLSDMIDANEG
jgi:hypothetical protein